LRLAGVAFFPAFAAGHRQGTVPRDGASGPAGPPKNVLPDPTRQRRALIWLDVTSGQQAYQAAGGLYYNYAVNAFEDSAAPAPGFAGVRVPTYLAVTQLGE
jgi:hypothetical protein